MRRKLALRPMTTLFRHLAPAFVAKARLAPSCEEGNALKRSILFGTAVLGSILSSPAPVRADLTLYVAQQPTSGATSQVAITELTSSGPVGTLATFSAPSYATGTDVVFMAFDSSGNLFASDYFGNTIKEITPSGSVSTFSSGFGGTMGGLAFDAHGGLYAARSNGDILKFGADGSYTVYATLPGGAAGLAFDDSGDLFAALRGGKSIVEVKPDGSTSTIVSSGLSAPLSLAFNSAGTLFVGDQADGILKVAKDGSISTFATIPDFYPATMAFGGDGNLYAADFNSILKITPDGTVSTFAAGLNSPAGLAILPAPEPSSLILIGGTGILLALGHAGRVGLRGRFWVRELSARDSDNFRRPV